MSLATVLFAASASAQPQQPQGQQGSRPEFQKGERPQMPSVDEMAKKKTDAMNAELCLTEAQYKKVLKLYKSTIQKERNLMSENRPQGMPQGGSPGGGQPPMGGGQPPMGGGRPPMSGGFSGGGPGMGGQDMSGGRPPMMSENMKDTEEELEKIYQKQDKKLKSILTTEQYSRWRSKHPVFDVPMPEFKMKVD